MIVKIEMAVEAIQEAQKRVRAKKDAEIFAKSISEACNNIADFINSITEQLEEELKKTKENEDTGNDSLRKD